MRKDLPNVYKNQQVMKNKNNKDSCYVDSQNKVDDKVKTEEHLVSVSDKLRRLFRSSRYVFNIGVIIETTRKTYDTKIAGQVKNSIVTVDGEVIPIIEIKDIIIKDRL